MLDSIYNMKLKLFCNCIFGEKHARFLPNLHAVVMGIIS